MSDRRMTVTDAARNLVDLVDRASKNGESTLLIRSGQTVARIVPVEEIGCSGSDFAARWRGVRHLDSQDAEDFAAEVEKDRTEFQLPPSAWD
ncbi:MAG: hypothetical protein KDM63_04800 [Verrucomicrobiae bacterium]|nr:hypothetical protein [Verrucomicrobiae bacterium]MCB1092964.1 hypothetical protein [Verrucomicrobiae bacterium]